MRIIQVSMNDMLAGSIENHDMFPRMAKSLFEEVQGV